MLVEKLVLNVGLNTYLGGSLTLQQVLDMVTYTVASRSLQFSVDGKEVLGSYEGLPEPTAVIKLEVYDKSVLVGELVNELCNSLCQESVAWVHHFKGGSTYSSLQYHKNIQNIKKVLDVNFQPEKFNKDYFINF